MNKISIIVPVYNVERYLNRCLDSIINQTYNNIEIILVNDGSTDNSLEICNSYREKDSRVVVINKKNGGQSSARNSGLKASTGNYIMFVDSDDKINLRCCELFIDTMLKNNSDIVIGSSSSNEKEIDKDLELNSIEVDLINDDILYNYFLIGKISVWGKLYKKSILSDIAFEYCKTSEESEFNYRAFKRCKKFSFIKSPIYYYNQESISICRSKLKLGDFYAIEISKNIADSVMCEKVKSVAMLHYYKAIYNIINKGLSRGYDNNESKKVFDDNLQDYINILKDNLKTINNSRYFSKTDKFQINLLITSRHLYVFFRKIYDNIIK